MHEQQEEYKKTGESRVESPMIVPEQREDDLEKIEGEIMADMQNELADFQRAGMDGMDGTNGSIKLEPEEFEKIKKESGIADKISSLREQAKKFFSEARLEIKRVVAISTAVVSFFGTMEVMAAQAETVNNPESIVSVEKNQRQKYDEEIAGIREMALNDGTEKSILLIKKGQDMEMMDNSRGVEERSFSFIDFEKADEYLKSGNCDLEFIHTHPLRLAGYSDAEQDEIRSGEMSAVPMPPSFTDIAVLALEKDHFKGERRERITNKVVDSSGVWEFSSDKDSKLISLMNEMSVVYENILDKIELNHEDKDLFQKKIDEHGDYVNKIHPGNRVGAILKLLRDDEKTLHIGEKLEKYIARIWLDLEKKHPDEMKDMAEIIKIELEVKGQYKDADFQVALKRQQDLFRKNGINITYNSFDEKQ